ncbi:hypothetical protein ACFFQF_03735 [Haladaptatus pallidirubidus]|uniref:DUF7310 domain-containing protein n=1 Tax=Haladaptatus pallidirubidus TaxID=1008152 RepID=A0AAV3UKQ9_9EURY|nr:hypothetical protein [Haladaptatus pallidirubidus]
MSDFETLDNRLRTVERALIDRNGNPVTHEDSEADDCPVVTSMTAPELTARVDELESRADDVEPRLDELDAAVQALRGYVGNIRAVNADVERRADAALAKTEAKSNRCKPSDHRPTHRETTKSRNDPPSKRSPELPTKSQLSAGKFEAESESGSIFARLRGML